MKIKNILKPFINDLKSFLKNNGEEDFVNFDEYENIDSFYIMICNDGSYYKVNMNHSYWYLEDDGTIVFRVNDR